MNYPDFLIIPFQLINDKDIEPIAEKLYGVIYWYANMKMERCFVSNIQLSKLLTTSPRTIQNALDALEKKNYIKRLYKDESRRHRIEIIPVISFKNQMAIAVTPEKQTATMVTLERNRGDQNKNISSKKNTATDTVAHKFSLKEEIQRMEESPRRDINIIAFYFDERQPDIQTREQLQVAIRRHLRDARDLKPFSNEQLVAALPKAKKITSEWTLSTLKKILTK